MDGSSTPGKPTGSGQPKRRPAASRTVEGMSEEQLRHKRAIDRKAQRALRQRTKDSLLNLEQQFAKLQETCAQQESELAFLRQRNEELQRRQDAIRDVLGHEPGPVPRHDVMTRSSPDTSHAREQVIVANSNHPAAGTEEPSHDIQSSPAVGSPALCPSAPPESRQDVDRDISTHGSSRLGLSNSTIPQRTDQEPHAHNPGIMHGSYPSAAHTVAQSDWSLMPTGTSSFVDASHDTHLSNTLQTPCSGIVAGQWQRPLPRAAFNSLPTYLPPSCPLDQILLDFIESRRVTFPSGQESETPLWPLKSKVQALLNPNLVQTVDALSAIISRVLSTFQHVDLPEKLAFFHLIYQTSKWLLQPTKENYLAMPPWLRPTVTQITVPHEIWIDTIPWPSVRDILIEHSDDYPFELFSEFYSHNVTVNWQFDEMDAISSDSSDTILHSIFEKHIRKISNWTVSSEFKSRFPEMISAIYPPR